MRYIQDTSIQPPVLRYIVVLRRGKAGTPDWHALAEWMQQEEDDGEVDDLLRKTVAVVKDRERHLENRDGHSICHILAFRKPTMMDEPVARGVLDRVLKACNDVGELGHKNHKDDTIVHCACAQHNYIFLEALLAIGNADGGAPLGIRQGGMTS